MIPAYAIGALALFFAVGAFLGWRKAGRVVLVGLLVLAVLFLLGRFIGQQGDGYSYFFYVMAAYLICLPGAAGLLGGAFLGWLAQRHKSN